MNLDVPYYKLGNQEKVEYIPLKLALNDDTDDGGFVETEKLMNQYNANGVEGDNNNGGGGGGGGNNFSISLIILISLAAFVVLFLLLYVIYYFVILRDRHSHSENIDDNDAFIFQ